MRGARADWRLRRHWTAYRARVCWPTWAGRWVRAWQAAVVGVASPLVLWAVGSVLFWLAAHTLRLLIIATAFGWLGTGCSAAAAVLPFVGGGLLVTSLFRPTPPGSERAAPISGRTDSRAGM